MHYDHLLTIMDASQIKVVFRSHRHPSSGGATIAPCLRSSGCDDGPRRRASAIDFVFSLAGAFIFLSAAAFVQRLAKDDAADVTDISLVMMAVSGVFAAMSIYLQRLNRRARQARLEAVQADPGERLRNRIAAVNDAFAEAVTLLDDLRRDLASQQAARAALEAQSEEQQRLLAIDEEQAGKIRKIIVGETKETIRAERRQQWMFFALGVAVSIPIGIMINLLVP